MRTDMTIEELVEGMYELSVKISAEYFPTDEEINALWRRNAVRLTAINGMMDGRLLAVPSRRFARRYG